MCVPITFRSSHFNLFIFNNTSQKQTNNNDYNNTIEETNNND